MRQQQFPGGPQIWIPDQKFADGKASALYFINDIGNPTLTVEIILASGRTLAEGSVKPGQRFYFEGSGIERLVVSTPHPVKIQPEALLLHTLMLKEMNPVQVYEINGRAALDQSFDEVSKRLKVTGESPFLNFSEVIWLDFQTQCNLVMKGDVDAWTRLHIAMNQRWELAVLSGFGFIDGATIEVPPFDVAAFGAGSQDQRLTGNAGPDKNYFYLAQITIEMKDGTDQDIWSSPAIMPAKAPKLSAPDYILEKACTVKAIDTQESKIINTQTGEDKMEILSDKRSYLCEGKVTALFNAGHNEILTLTPDISKSILKNLDPTPTQDFRYGLFDAPSEKPCLTWEDLHIYRMLSFETEVPFIDSKVGFYCIAGDGWDRSMSTTGIAQRNLELIYNSIGPQIATAVCDTFPAKATLHLSDVPVKWAPREIDVLLNSTLVILQQRALEKAFFFEITVGLAAPHGDGFAATIHFAGPTPDPLAMDALIGGRLVVGEVQGTVMSIDTDPSGEKLVVFDLLNICARAVLFEDGAAGKIEEMPDSERIWHEVAAISMETLSLSGNKLVPVDLLLNEKWKSQLFRFVTQLRTKFRDNDFSGPISLPDIAAQYTAPPPEKPVGQFSVQSIGIEFYGRRALRIQGAEFDVLDSRFQHRMCFTSFDVEENIDGFTDNIITDYPKVEESIRKHQIIGEIGYQNSFDYATLFDLIDAAAHRESSVIAVTAKNGNENESKMLIQKSRRIL